MAHPGATRSFGPAILVLACLLSTAAAQAPAPTAAIAPSSNISDPCYTDPSAPSCSGFRRTDEDWAADLQSLCSVMPYMVGCSMWHQCTSGEALGDSPYCSLASLAGNICVADGMQRMKGCEAYGMLCANGTVVEQCLSPGLAPNVLTTFQAKASIDGVCTSHSMDGCQDCTSVGRTNFRSCPEVLNILSKLCVSMPEMEQCGEFHTFCGNATLAAAFPKVCTQDAADGSSTSLPPMRMWFHQSAREIFLFKEWVPSSTGQYIGLCIAMCALAVLTQFLKAVRLRVEMSWSAQMRLKCVCPESSCELAATGDPEAGSTGSGASLPSSAKLAEAPLPPCCQGGGGVGGAGRAAAAIVPLPLVPTSRRKPFWRSSQRGMVSCFGVDLITRAQAVRNFWRACFTFVVIFLDYALMLVVMTFNIGIILAVCGGFAIGALLFGHAGERPAAPQPRAPAAPRPALAGSSSSEEDLEAVFVEGPGCCSGGLSSTA